MNKSRPLIAMPKRELLPKTPGCNSCKEKKKKIEKANNSFRVRGGRLF